MHKLHLKRTPIKRQKSQKGATMIIGVLLLALLVLAVIGISLYLVTLKNEPTLTYNPPAVTADDQLTTGKSNKELIQDARIINEGVKRDDTQRTAADAALSDQTQPIGDATDTATTVETSRLSALQTAFINETDRRLKKLDETARLLPKLTVAQQEPTKKLIIDETTALTGLKAKAAAETTFEAFSADKAALEKEHGNYLLAISQVNLLVWTNGQALVEDKVNVLGGKYQERLNDASSQGRDIAKAQILVNSLQANKTTAKGLTAIVLKAASAVKPGDYNANRSVLKTYYSQLSTAHDELEKVLKTASDLTLEMAKLSPV